MGPSGIVKLEVPPESSSGFRDRFVGSQVHLLVLDALPQSFDEHRQLVIAVDHRLAPGNPAFVSAASKKSFSNASSPILSVKDLHIYRLFSLPCPGAK